MRFYLQRDCWRLSLCSFAHKHQKQRCLKSARYPQQMIRQLLPWIWVSATEQTLWEVAGEEGLLLAELPRPRIRVEWSWGLEVEAPIGHTHTYTHVLLVRYFKIIFTWAIWVRKNLRCSWTDFELIVGPTAHKRARILIAALSMQSGNRIRHWAHWRQRWNSSVRKTVWYRTEGDPFHRICSETIKIIIK